MTDFGLGEVNNNEEYRRRSILLSWLVLLYGLLITAQSLYSLSLSLDQLTQRSGEQWYELINIYHLQFLVGPAILMLFSVVLRPARVFALYFFLVYIVFLVLRGLSYIVLFYLAAEYTLGGWSDAPSVFGFGLLNFFVQSYLGVQTVKLIRQSRVQDGFAEKPSPSHFEILSFLGIVICFALQVSAFASYLNVMTQIIRQ